MDNLQHYYSVEANKQLDYEADLIETIKDNCDRELKKQEIIEECDYWDKVESDNYEENIDNLQN